MKKQIFVPFFKGFLLIACAALGACKEEEPKYDSGYVYEDQKLAEAIAKQVAEREARKNTPKEN